LSWVEPYMLGLRPFIGIRRTSRERLVASETELLHTDSPRLSGRGRDKLADDPRQWRLALPRTTNLEIDPALVEAVDHPDPRSGIFDSLRAEPGLPAFTRNDLNSHRTIQRGSKRRGEVSGADSSRALQLDHLLALPVAHQQFRGDFTDVLAGYHGNGPIRWLKKTRKDAFVAGGRS
jgi:hypothetical protein